MTDLAPPAPAAPPGRPRTGRFAALAAAAVVAVLVLAVFLWWPRTSTVRTFTQPATVTYSDGVTHLAILKRVTAPVTAVDLTGTLAPDHYEIFLGSDPGGGYGHHLRLDATDLDPAGLTVEWTAEGAWLTFPPMDHRLLVPAKAFVGGR